MPLSHPILDGHAHAFPDDLAPRAMASLTAGAHWQPVTPHHDGTVAGLLASMDRAGVQRAVLCSIATRPAQVAKITDWSAQINNPRIIPLASIHPDFPDPEAEAFRIASLGIKGLKYHPHYMNCAVNDPRTLRIAHAAAAAGLAMTFHAGHDLAFPKSDLAAPLHFRQLHEAVPTLRLQTCHLGGWQRWEESLEHLAGQPIYMETSYSLNQCPPDLLEKIIAKHSPEYLMFGTDSPWADHAADLSLFLKLPLSPSAQKLALWENGHRWLRVEV